MGALNRIAHNLHPDVFIEKGDSVIFSSKIIPGNVRKHYNLHNKLLKDGIEVVSEETEFVHVSGHPNKEDLKDMYKWIKPKSIIPVHGEHRHMKEQINFAKEMKIQFQTLVENGDIVKIHPGKKPEIFDKAPSGRLCVDGTISTVDDSFFIKERKNIANNGLIDITLVVLPNGQVDENASISLFGLPIIDTEDFKFEIKKELFKVVKTFSFKNIKQEENIIDVLKKSCRKFSKQKTGKKPLTNINIVRI